MAATRRTPYPPIADYAFISDCHSSALVSRAGSVDWCCMPRTDAPSVFGRLLDWGKGGCFVIAPAGAGFQIKRRYLDDTLVLETTFTAEGGEAAVLDCFTMRSGGRERPHRQLLRIVEGRRGTVAFKVLIQPRFDYCEVRPWIRRRDARDVAAIGADSGLLISANADLALEGDHEVTSAFTVRAEERVAFSVEWHRPEQLVGEMEHKPTGFDQNLERFDETLTWWRRWAESARLEGPDGPAVKRSALVLRGLVNAPTGAIAAAPTTSLPEALGGERNWDYRFSWIRDSALSIRSLTEIGVDREADGFRRFIQRSAAGSADDLQIMYGLGGERRLTEVRLRSLEGYRGSRPVRIGNAASRQLQLDAYGELMNLSWIGHQRGWAPDDDYWRFLLDLVDAACERWKEADHGIWEIRGKPLHFVYSKANCWAAVDRGIALAEASRRAAPLERWRRIADEMKAKIEERGYDQERGVFTQAFGKPQMDASLLLLPATGFVDWADERMVRTADAVKAELMANGLLLRYRLEHTDDGLEGEEGVFIACTFWLAECLARQGRSEEARQVFDRAAGTCNDLGLFSEEYDPTSKEMLGNFPQGLSHLSHIAAAVALVDGDSAPSTD